ncbi:tagaturonate reductase [Arcticibacterium luteifluviistationis]|uniref:Altronate oxidoreductase n=1 Tax=Arcticibacterium luteifluviistationis TaxID=1784714 RepID=A0A2Z4G988_9BACT|nr:tagaturonate reductase [Arcticibacterium luteifluviistationis]AWV97714.1 altronate oxidoreductase [Arcticibacterium luteifluviistationis]
MDYLSLNYLTKKSDLGFERRVLYYPEKIIQFGTGVLLKGLPDIIIDHANKNGAFEGKIVMIKSTDAKGTVESLVSQDCLYTVATRGISDKRLIDKQDICTSISRILIAKTQWASILSLSRKEEIQFVFSNTTELGITYEPEKITPGECPNSFPGKVLAILKSRFEHFNGDLSKGLIFLPTELISNNGDELKRIVFQLAKENFTDMAFLSWLKSANTFCNTLVDRIVPGAANNALDDKLPYKDQNAIVVEPYALWAIEGDQSIKDKLTFCLPENGAFVAPNIEKYKEIKLRILNAAHTFSSGLAFLSGYRLVKDAMKNQVFYAFMKTIMAKEISEAMTSEISDTEKKDFAQKVLDRFRNPFLEHQWLSICMNYSYKMTMRCLPLIKSYYQEKKEVPQLMLLGFTAHLAFLRPVKIIEGKYYGEVNGEEYIINDPHADFFYKTWSSTGSDKLKIQKILENEELWGENLNNLNSFAGHVYNTFSTFEEKGIDKTLSEIISKTEK